MFQFDGANWKGHFCFEVVRKASDLLDIKELPPQHLWYSTLKNENISDADYAECCKIWNELPAENRCLLSFMEQYNKR